MPLRAKTIRYDDSFRLEVLKMALINCPECGKEVSDRAYACPNCGFPIIEIKEKKELDISTEIVNIHSIIDSWIAMPKTNRSLLSEILPRLISEIDKIRGKYEGYDQEAISKCEDEIAKEILYCSKVGHSYCSWQTHKAFYEQVRFDLLSDEVIEMIGGFVYQELTYIKDRAVGIKGNSAHILYWYVIYQLFLYGNDTLKEMLEENLQRSNAFGKKRITDYEKFVANNLNDNSTMKESIKIGQISQQTAVPNMNSDKKKNNVPKCPTCGSHDVKRISGTERWISTGMVGIASSSLGKTMYCKNCGYKW